MQRVEPLSTVLLISLRKGSFVQWRRFASVASNPDLSKVGRAGRETRMLRIIQAASASLVSSRGAISFALV